MQVIPFAHSGSKSPVDSDISPLHHQWVKETEGFAKPSAFPWLMRLGMSSRLPLSLQYVKFLHCGAQFLMESWGKLAIKRWRHEMPFSCFNEVLGSCLGDLHFCTTPIATQTGNSKKNSTHRSTGIKYEDRRLCIDSDRLHFRHFAKLLSSFS